MTTEPTLLVGAGGMSVAYAQVLTALDHPFDVLGRGADSAATFEAATGVAAGTGPLDEQLQRRDTVAETAIVSVNAMHLTEVTAQLARAGVKRLLVEKPAALDGRELDELVAVAAETGADIRIGYNRRYLASVRAARQMVAEDGGVLSVKCDFSEPSRRIGTLDKPQRELDTWFYGNSSHVVDLALHFVGDCDETLGAVAGGVPWHPAAGVFVGHAHGVSGALLSWHANWIGPGRWGVEVITAERRLILQPLEQLRVQSHDGFDEVPVELDAELDRAHKPGLMLQVRAFLYREDDEHLCTLEDHRRRHPTFESIRTGARLSVNGGGDAS